MLHRDHKTVHDRLHTTSRTSKSTHRCATPIEEHVYKHTPQITVRGLQIGIDRGAADVFHRLHHGPGEDATTPDPCLQLSEEEAMKRLSSKLQQAAKPMGITKSCWAKVKASQGGLRQSLEDGTVSGTA